MWAVVTGGSSGIGLAFTKEAARRGYSVVVVSNSQEQLFDVMPKLKSEFAVEFVELCQDLSDRDASSRLFDFCVSKNIFPDILINNAGFFYFEEHISCSQNKISTMIDLHVRTLALNCRLFGEQMAKRGGGYILNISSMSADVSMPLITVYSATKAFIKIFSKSLRYEMRDYGVNVMVVCPGAVNTSLYNLSDKLRRIAVGTGIMIQPEKLAKKSFSKMFRGRGCYTPGFVNVITPFFLALMPMCIVIKIKRWLLEIKKR